MAVVQPVASRIAELEETYQLPSVWLHIYDLGPVTKWVVNSWAKPLYCAGLFHAGIEVLGSEFAFRGVLGSTSAEPLTGLCCHTPKANTHHVYRESVYLGLTPLSKDQIVDVLEMLEVEWTAASYHAVFRNCVDFAECFAKELRTPLCVPDWVNACARRCSSEETMSWLTAGSRVLSSASSCGSLSGFSGASCSRKVRRQPRNSCCSSTSTQSTTADDEDRLHSSLSTGSLASSIDSRPSRRRSTGSFGL